MDISSDRVLLSKAEMLNFIKGLTNEQKQMAIKEFPTTILWNEMEQRVMKAEKFNSDFKELADKYKED